MPWRTRAIGTTGRPAPSSASRIVHIVRTDEALEEAALNVYERLGDARLSFTDCVSFAVMRALEISAAFAFDSDFERVGFQLVRGMVP